MSWSALTAAQVQQRFVSAELSKLSDYLAAGQTDPVPEEISNGIAEVRGYIAAGGFPLGAGGTIPAKLVSAALSIIVFRVASRLPDSALVTDTRRRLYEDAVALLERVADRKFAVESPTESDTETTASVPIEQPGAPDRVATRDKLGGL
jgi:phage gp36-like protein